MKRIWKIYQIYAKVLTTFVASREFIRVLSAENAQKWPENQLCKMFIFTIFAQDFGKTQIIFLKNRKIQKRKHKIDLIVLCKINWLFHQNHAAGTKILGFHCVKWLRKGPKHNGAKYFTRKMQPKILEKRKKMTAIFPKKFQKNWLMAALEIGGVMPDSQTPLPR